MLSPPGARAAPRRKAKGEIYGVSADDVRSYLKAAQQQGMATIEELKVNRNGDIEVEGDDENGAELELKFRIGSLEPLKIERDK